MLHYSPVADHEPRETSSPELMSIRCSIPKLRYAQVTFTRNFLLSILKCKQQEDPIKFTSADPRLQHMPGTANPEMDESVDVRGPVNDNSGRGRVYVPGFGLPIDWIPTGFGEDEVVSYFPGSDDVFLNIRMTIREVAMLQFMDTITDKPDWTRKVFDETITSKWQEEAAARKDNLINEAAFKWCLTELKDRALKTAEDGLTRTLEGGKKIIKSDTVIDAALKEELVESLAPLLNVNDTAKDWHPTSNGQVLNLVHPSLYPLVYGRSRILDEGQVGLLSCVESIGNGVLIEADNNDAQMLGPDWKDEPDWRKYYGRYWSSQFQWLPAEVKFRGESGTDVQFTSYINNLEPRKHQPLYEVLSKFVARSIPAWNEVLLRGNIKNNGLRIRSYSPQIDPPEQPEWLREWDWSDPECNSRNNQELLQKLRDYLKLPENPDLEADDDYEFPENFESAPLTEWSGHLYHDRWDFWGAAVWKYGRIRRIKFPEPEADFSYEDWATSMYEKDYDQDSRDEVPLSPGTQRDMKPTSLETEFRAKGLQVIVKLASIELTPDKPSYAGGSWHVEGMRNEHIIATAIYYYDVRNCSASRLSFRQQASLSDLSVYSAIDDERHDRVPLATTFGLRRLHDERAVQKIGSVDTREGRMLVFPNDLQHKVEPFQLIDDTKPGHRRFLVLWLVDPMYRIASTANVPPQQVDWLLKHSRMESWNRNLPAEITAQIEQHIREDAMTLEDAKRLRLELMAERTTFDDAVEGDFESYNFCEH